MTGDRGSVTLAAIAKRLAAELGFEACGITTADRIERDALTDWLASGYHAGMKWLERQAPTRRDPGSAVPGAISVVVVLHNYYTQQPVRYGEYRVARYAQGEDYHRLTLGRLDVLGHRLVGAAGSGRWRAYVDAGPMPERELAARAGLGWLAKNTMLINPRLGSFTFIGVLLTDLELAPDEPFEADRCGTCTACLDACPTDAFVSERVLDARRCISYLTIEERRGIPEEFHAAIGDNLFGCDICQDVCPWNQRFAVETAEPAFRAGPDEDWPTLDEILAMDQAAFDERFGRTAIERARLAGLKRNALVVSGGRYGS